MKPSVSSLYQAVEIEQDPKPLLIGERCNANGSKAFRERLLADDYEGCLRIAVEQETGGAHLLDLCTAYAGRDEKTDLLALVPMLARSVRMPLVIDSTTPDCIEACLRIYPGRCIVNSINLEDGGKNLNRICPLLKKYGAAVIALTIDEKGMAMKADEKVAVARRILDLAVGRHGLRPQDLIFDPLTFTVGAGDETLRDAAVQTIGAIRRIKAELPGVYTSLGLSNISFGLPPAARRVLNSVFLHEAVEAGLDAAIVDAGKILPLATISAEDREICLNLLFDRVKDPEKKPLNIFIEHFQAKSGTAKPDEAAKEPGPAEEALFDRIVRGDKDGVEDLLAILMRRYVPTAIINRILVPSMRHVGELFGKGEILLPFVLQSAEVMKKAVAHLEPFMDRSGDAKGVSILLATVQGDVHDIGKNLVDIILSNNGYKVHNLGIKVPAETILAKAKELKVDLVGLSGLLVKSAIVMQESMPQYREAGLGVPILLGGAALTKKFVAVSCAPGYDRPVVYCADAFAGLQAVQDFEAGTLKATTWDPSTVPTTATAAALDIEVRRDGPAPTPPFLGARHVTDVPVEALFSYINDEALFRGRWGYRRGRMGADEYRALIEGKVRPLYAEFRRRAVEDRLVQPKVAYGYYRCWSRGETLFVEDGGTVHEFGFPRRTEPPRICIADFFKTEAEGGDVAGFFVVTIGERIDREIHDLFTANAYHDYLMLHGFSVEVTDALAEYWHERMRGELGIGSHRPKARAGYVVQDYQGSRYGFGYPSCPDLGAHGPVFAMLDPGAIGVTLTENFQMVPEQSTSAIVVHHPQAKYFAV
ncbi:MAG: 5-methyltetrahydrofolate--homocysteine methyltransferase [Verrucomicrobia bacterium A1]|nr:MAG: 5-methyltetrahydrofolate--homocysteine methyltransferase [Verrucomicrobia bacterium A1]